jgi:hypothetical protein
MGSPIVGSTRIPRGLPARGWTHGHCPSSHTIDVGACRLGPHFRSVAGKCARRDMSQCCVGCAIPRAQLLKGRAICKCPTPALAQEYSLSHIANACLFTVPWLGTSSVKRDYPKTRRELGTPHCHNESMYAESLARGSLHQRELNYVSKERI